MPRAESATATGPTTAQSDDAEWEQFQAFVAQVEKSDDAPADDRDAQEEGEEDGSARDAEQSLENMAYVDRFRQALEHATAATAVSHPSKSADVVLANGTKRERPGEEDQDKDNGEEVEVEDVSTIVRVAAQESAKRRKLLHQGAEASHDHDNSDSNSDSDDSDALDLSNWRSKRI